MLKTFSFTEKQEKMENCELFNSCKFIISPNIFLIEEKYNLYSRIYIFTYLILYIVFLYVQIMPVIINTQKGKAISNNYCTTQNTWISTYFHFGEKQSDKTVIEIKMTANIY